MQHIYLSPHYDDSENFLHKLKIKIIIELEIGT